MTTIVPSNSTYIVMPSTNGLTRSPPGVAAAAKIAIPRTAHPPRVATAAAEVTMPTRDSPYEQDRELHDQAEHEEHVVTKSKYGPAVITG